MPVDDIRFVIVAIAFGGMVGWGLGRLPQDRRASRWASGVAVVAGIAAWVGWNLTDPPDRSWGAAAVALTFGGVSSLVVLAFPDRRSSPPGS